MLPVLSNAMRWRLKEHPMIWEMWKKAFYAWEDATCTFAAYALDVLELRGDRIAAVVSFIDGERFGSFGLPPALTG